MELPDDIQELVDELRESAERVPVPLDLPDEDDLVVIEEELLLSLPKDYKLFFLHASDIVYGGIEPFTVADSGSYNHLPEVTAEAWDNGLPRYLIPICRHGMGYYCLNSDGEIFTWEEGELSDIQFESIWEWVQDVWLRS